MKKTNKLISLEDAVKLINNNSRVALGGFGIYQRPMAFVREMINQKIKYFEIVFEKMASYKFSQHDYVRDLSNAYN